MEITFKDGKTRRLCETRKEAERQLGADSARKLRIRLADLAGGKRLVFEPDLKPCPEREDGAVDWQRVTRIRILYIGDYHD